MTFLVTLTEVTLRQQKNVACHARMLLATCAPNALRCWRWLTGDVVRGTIGFLESYNFLMSFLTSDFW